MLSSVAVVTPCYLHKMILVEKMKGKTYRGIGLLKGLVLVLLMQACSTTSSDLRGYIKDYKAGSISSRALYIDRSQTVLASQTDGGLFELHHSGAELEVMTKNVAGKFGFDLVSKPESTYIMNLKTAYPDGGACDQGSYSAADGLSYTASILTFGIVPATNTHCYRVSVDLYERIGGELLLVGEFVSVEGRVDVYAGANEVDNYRLTVTKRDEAFALETSLAALFSHMLSEGAFE